VLPAMRIKENGRSWDQRLICTTRKLGRLWFRYSFEEIFRKAVIGRNGRKGPKNTRCSCQPSDSSERPERFELPTFWFVGRSAKTSKCRYWYAYEPSAPLIPPLNWTEPHSVNCPKNRSAKVRASAKRHRLWSAKIAYAAPTEKLKDPFGVLRPEFIHVTMLQSPRILLILKSDEVFGTHSTLKGRKLALILHSGVHRQEVTERMISAGREPEEGGFPGLP